MTSQTQVLLELIRDNAVHGIEHLPANRLGQMLTTLLRRVDQKSANDCPHA